VASRQRPRGATHLKGLGNRHRLQRERLMRAHVDGSPCGLCGRPMYRDRAQNHDGQPLHADHEVPRAIAGPQSLATRLVCGSCNTREGGRLRAAIAAGRSEPIEPIEPDRTGLAFAWP
jgi:hypothetical protein